MSPAVSRCFGVDEAVEYADETVRVRHGLAGEFHRCGVHQVNLPEGCGHFRNRRVTHFHAHRIAGQTFRRRLPCRRHRRLGRVLNIPTRGGERTQLHRPRVDGALHHHAAHCGHGSLLFLHRHIVACDEDHRHAVPAREKGIHAPLANREPVDLQVAQHPRPRVREDATWRPSLGVVSHEYDRIEGGVEPLHHAVALEAVTDEAHPRIEILRQDVALAAVRVVHDHLGGPAIEGPANGRVGILRHQLAGTPVLGAGGRRLVVAVDAADAFHVHRDVDLACLGRRRIRQDRHGDERRQRDAQ